MHIHIIEDEKASQSIKRYVRELRENLSDNDTVETIYFLRGRGGVVGLLRKYFLLPLRLLKAAPEYVIIPSERYSFLLPFLLRSRSLIVCHDLHTLMDRNVSWYHKCFYKWNLRLLHLATRIVCISNHTKEDLSQVVHLPKEKCHVIYNGLHAFWREQEVSDEFVGSELQLPDQSYILMVGSKAWYKNQLNAFKALCEIRNLTVVKVGEIDEPSNEFIRRSTITDSILLRPYVSDLELRALYKHAALLLFPSIHEGFGWPALEALAVGCPVVTTRKASLEEVCDDAAIYVDPYDVKSIAAGIEQVLQDEDRRQQLIARGRTQADKFRWTSTVDTMKKLLKPD